MRLEILLTLLSFFTSSHGLHQDETCGTVPGESAVPHTVGNFTFPNGNTPSFSEGTSMNISWSTTFELSTLWLITGCDFANPTKSLIAGSSATYYVWDVETDSTNSSQLYSFRVVDSAGNSEDQKSGGFWSAVFYISGGDILSSSLSSTSSLASSTTLASTTATITHTSSASSLPSISSLATVPAGLSTGAQAGIGVGVSLGVVGFAGLATGFYFWRKRQNKTQEPQVTEASGNQKYWAPQSSLYYDHHNTNVPHVSELYDTSDPQPRPMYELGNSENNGIISQRTPTK